MEKQKSSKFLLGTIGAILGAFIGAIPWILVYVYGNLIVAVLSIVIAVASYYGYKITKAKIDKKLPFIVAISSVLAITVSTFIIIPLILMAREGLDVSLENLQAVYEFDEFRNAVIGDYAISLIFTIVGISGIIANLNRQIKEGKTADEIKLNVSNQQLYTQEEVQAVKEIFEKNNALDKENGIAKDDVIQELNTQVTEIRAKQLFNLLKGQGIIRKKSGKFYFFEKAQSTGYKAKKAIILFITILVIFFIGIFAIIMATSNNSNKNNSTNKSSNSSSLSDSIEDGEDYDFESEKEYINKESGIKFVPTDDLIMITEENLDTYYGEGASDVYKMMATNMDSTIFISCFIYDDEEMKDYTGKELLENTLNQSDFEEIETITIAGFEFQAAKLSFEDNGKEYIEYCYVYKMDSGFLCFDYSYPSGEENQFDKMIKKQ